MAGRTLEWDWYPGTVPDNVITDETAYLESSYSFTRFRSEQSPAVQIGEAASIYLGTMFDLGPGGSVNIGRYCILTAPQIMADGHIEIGDYALIGWNVIIMDSYRFALDPDERREQVRQIPSRPGRVPDFVGTVQPVSIGSNAWVSFDVVVMPGVSIGEGSVVRARSVVAEDVAPYTIVSGNPARLVSRAPRPDAKA
jgi:acetyltransferase-like isoleucine patch superfamily enzyme